jgi:hypothetical protein
VIAVLVGRWLASLSDMLHTAGHIDPLRHGSVFILVMRCCGLSSAGCIRSCVVVIFKMKLTPISPFAAKNCFPKKWVGLGIEARRLPGAGRHHPRLRRGDLRIGCRWKLTVQREDIRSLPLKERRAILDQVAKRYGLQKSELFIGCGKSLLETVCAHISDPASNMMTAMTRERIAKSSRAHVRLAAICKRRHRAARPIPY